MPIPDEWLAAGCPALRRVHLHDGQWQADGLILSMQAGEAKFAFTAARIDRLGVPLIKAINEIQEGISFSVEITSSTRPEPVQTTIDITTILVTELT
jgi:hypothetical protein